MALLHRATIAPSKGELVQEWLPSRPWAPPGPIAAGVSYRLDDPAGEVGMEGFLLTDADGRTVHVPLSYRGEPLAGAEQHLLGTMEHSVLGTRWVYDGCADPVWAAAFATVILTGDTQAEEFLDAGGRSERREPQVSLRGSGQPGTPVPSTDALHLAEDDSATTLSGDGIELVVVRRVGVEPSCPHTVSAAWDGGHRVPIAGLRRT